MAEKHLRNSSTFPSHKGNSNQNNRRFHITPVKMVEIKTQRPGTVEIQGDRTRETALQHREVWVKSSEIAPTPDWIKEAGNLL